MKQQLKLELKQIKARLAEIIKTLPHPKLPQILKEGRQREEMQQIESVIDRTEQDYQLEKELKSIQEKLAKLQQ
jgi:hypothetical protein